MTAEELDYIIDPTSLIHRVEDILIKLSNKQKAFWKDVAGKIRKIGEEEEIREELDFAGYEYRNGTLIPYLASKDDAVIVSHPSVIDDFRKHIRALKDLYSDCIVRILTLNVNGQSITINLDIVMTYGQEIMPSKLDIGNGPFLIHHKTIGRKTALDIDSMIRNRMILGNGIEAKIEQLNWDSWGNVGTAADLPRWLKYDGPFKALRVHTKRQISSLLSEYGIDVRQSINMGEEIFESFDDFTLANVGHRIGLGHNMRMQVIAPWWTRILNVDVLEVRIIRVHWECPTVISTDLSIQIVFPEKEGQRTFKPESTESSDDSNGMSHLTSSFSIPSISTDETISYAIHLNHRVLGEVEKAMGTISGDVEISPVLAIEKHDRDEILHALFPKYYSETQSPVNSWEVDSLFRMSEDLLREKLASVLLQCDFIGDYDKSLLQEDVEKGHSGYEGSDLHTHLTLNGERIRVDFAIKDGDDCRGIKRKTIPLEFAHQIEGPVQRLRSQLCILFAPCPPSDPLRQQIEGHPLSTKMGFIYGKMVFGIFGAYGVL
ncbi:MAG: hypothetical protein ACFFER_10530 [Candidatus Thorarchaeota archaeon]